MFMNLNKSTLSKYPFIIIPLMLISLILLCGHLVKFLWNATITNLFSTKPISFWRALMLFLLARILIGDVSVGKNQN